MIWLYVIAASICVIALAAWWFCRRPGFSPDGGFVHWVKDPSYKRAVSHLFALADESRARAHTLSDSEIRQLAERLLAPEDDFVARRTLDAVGERAVPFLVDALADERSALVPPDADSLFDTPIDRILRLLSPFAPRDVVPHLLRHVGHENDFVNRCVIEALANVGSDDCIKPTISALRESGQRIRSGALRGIESAARSGRVSAKFRGLIFPELERLARAGEDEAFSCAIALDRNKAVPLLLDILRTCPIGNRAAKLLEVLNQHEVTADIGTIERIMHEYEPGSDGRGNARCYCSLLLHLGRHDNHRARQLAEAAITGDDSELASRAGDVYLELHGAAEAWDKCFTRANSSGLSGLSQNERFAFLARIAVGTIQNGGLDSFFVHGYARHFDETCRAFEAIGLPEVAAILRQAGSLFGPAGPPADPEECHAARARFSRAKEEEFERLSRAFWDADDRFDANHARFIVAHLADFTV